MKNNSVDSSNFQRWQDTIQKFIVTCITRILSERIKFKNEEMSEEKSYTNMSDLENFVREYLIRKVFPQRK